MQPSEEIEPAPSARLDGADRRILLAVAALVAFSAVYVHFNYRAAFPQASLRLELSRQQITARAAAFLRERGAALAGYRNLTLFDPDDNARLFLERESGLEQANRLMQDEVPVWQWRARWYRPPLKEEFEVWLAPQGRLVGFNHDLAEDAAGARLSAAEARALAESQVRRMTSHPLRLVEEKAEEKPNRRDHRFTWEREGFRIQDATYRYTVVVRGGKVEGFREFLHVPEAWQREFAALRSKNELYTQIAQVFAVVLALAALVLLGQGLRRRTIDWRPVLWVSTVVAVLMVASEWNSLPFYLDSLSTSTGVAEGIGLGLLQGLGAGVGVFFYVLVAAAPGSALYARMLPQWMSFRNAFSRTSLQSREFFRAAVVGYGFAAAHLAFLVAFYVIGRRFGVWSPQDVEYSNLLSTAVPWLYPLTISVLASTSEEFWFRLLAIPLLIKATRSRLLAVVVPALVWGFLHANYPQQPGYIRGIEVGLIGIAAGWVFLRFGILATLIWHYTIDAALIGSFLIEAGNWYFRLAGLVVAGLVLLPLAVSLWLYRRRGGFLENVEAAPEPQPAEAASGEAPAVAPEPPLAPVWSPRILFAVAILLGLALVLLPSLKPGDFQRIKLTRAEAQARASAVPGGPAPPAVTVTGYSPRVSGAEFEYLRQRLGWRAANEWLQANTAHSLWRIRRFRPGEKHELRLWLNQDGRVVNRQTVLDEKAPGPDLDPAAAQALAFAHLQQATALSPDRLREVDRFANKHDHRTDHTFVWEDTQRRVGAAQLRYSVTVAAGEPALWGPYLKLPEEWLRAYSRPRIQRYLLPALLGGAGLLLVIVVLRELSRHPLRLGLYVRVGLVGATLVAVWIANDLPTLYAAYPTEQPLKDYQLDVALRSVMLVLLGAFGAAWGALMLDVLLGLAQGERHLPRPEWRQVAALALILAGASRVLSWLAERVPGERLSLGIHSIPGVDAWSPALAVLVGAVGMALVGTLVIGSLASAAVALFTPRRRLGYALVLAAGIALARASDPLLVLFLFGAALAVTALVSLTVRTCAAAVLSLAAALFLVQGINGAWTLIAQPAPSLRAQGAAALAATLLITAAWVWLWELWGQCTQPPISAAD